MAPERVPQMHGAMTKPKPYRHEFQQQLLKATLAIEAAMPEAANLNAIEDMTSKSIIVRNHIHGQEVAITRAAAKAIADGNEDLTLTVAETITRATPGAWELHQQEPIDA